MPQGVDGWTLTYDDVTDAQKILQRFPCVHRTPIVTCKTVDKLTGRKIYFKCENFQKAGSFKIRGALPALVRLQERGVLTSHSPGEPRPLRDGVIAFSSGNFGQGVAYAAQELNIPCCVAVTESVPESKVTAIKEYGAEVIRTESTPHGRRQAAEKYAAEHNYHVLPPSDEFDVTAGFGSLAVELVEQVPQLDAVLCPVSGGSLAASVAAVVKHMKPEVKYFCVEPKGKDLQPSLRAEKRLWPEPPHFVDTIADAIRLQPVGKYCFPVLAKLAEKDVLTVGDSDIASTMKLMMTRMKMVIETTGAITLAAILNGQLDAADPEKKLQHVVLVVSGGNADFSNLPF